MKLLPFTRISSSSSFKRNYYPNYFKCFHTLHEESAGGLNGRLARLAQIHPPSELIAFYRSLGSSDRSQLSTSSFNYILAALLRDGQQIEAFQLISQLESTYDKGDKSDKGDGGDSKYNHFNHCNNYNNYNHHNHYNNHLNDHRNNMSHVQNSTAKSSFPNRETFTVLIGGLVEADPTGSLAMTIDEVFELMRQKYSIEADAHLWSLRIRAFLHQKFLNPACPALEPARIFYIEMCDAVPEARNLPNIRADLIITAVSRRLWSFAEWLLIQESSTKRRKVLTELTDLSELTELTDLTTKLTTKTTSSSSSSSSSPSSSNSTNSNSSALFSITNAPGLFLETASLPILRFITTNLPPSALSINFNECLLVYCWRQGQVAADLALTALRALIRVIPSHGPRWIETAQGCLQRQLPRDYYILDTDEARNRLLESVNRLKCPQADISALEEEIKHQKLMSE